MTSKSFFYAAALCFCLFASRPAFAQTAPESKQNSDLNRKAQALLSDTVTLTRQLKNRDNQVLSRIALAELQWSDQEKSARQLYQEAFELVRRAWSNLDPDDEDAPYNEHSIIRLRDRLVKSVAEHDSTMARQLFEQLRVTGPSADTNTGTESNSESAQSERAEEDKTLETQIAAAAAEKNPDEMVGVIRKELDGGSLNMAVSLLENLARKDPEKAGSLMGDIIDKFRKVDYVSDTSAMDLTVFLLSQALASLPKNKKELEQRGQKWAIPLSPDLSRQIFELVIDAVLNPKADRLRSVFLNSLREGIEDIAEVVPAQADRLRKKFGEIDKQNESSSYTNFQQIAAKNDLAPMLEAARTAPPELRDGFYGEAAATAWEQGDRDKAKEIVEKNIRSAFERNRLLRTFRENTIAELIKKGDLVQARQLIQQTRSIESRVSQLIDLAAAHAAKKENKAALEILNEAQNLLREKPANQTELELELRLATAFAQVDLDRSFALVGAAIDQINELANAAAKLSNFIGPLPEMKDGEFELESSGMPGIEMVPGMRTILSRQIRPLAAADFEKTRKTFDRFERPEFRFSAHLFLGRMVLEPADQDCSCSCPGPAANSPKSAPKN